MTEPTKPQAPEWLVNATGAKCHRDTIPAIRLTEDQLVRDHHARAEALSAYVRAEKEAMFADVEAFRKLQMELYGVPQTSGEQRGFANLSSFDGSKTLQIADATTMYFGSELDAVKKLLEGFLERKGKGIDPIVHSMAMASFQKNRNDDVQPDKVWALTKIDGSGTEDEDWQNIIRAIRDAVRYRLTNTHMRFHRLVNGKREQIPLDFSKMERRNDEPV
jgi:hypothetical protein